MSSQKASDLKTFTILFYFSGFLMTGEFSDRGIAIPDMLDCRLIGKIH
ncbi:MAG TPA: hypothetical protein V6C85_08745 [Allocoleopsis sp.]